MVSVLSVRAFCKRGDRCCHVISNSLTSVYFLGASNLTLSQQCPFTPTSKVYLLCTVGHGLVAKSPQRQVPYILKCSQRCESLRRRPLQSYQPESAHCLVHHLLPAVSEISRFKMLTQTVKMSVIVSSLNACVKRRNMRQRSQRLKRRSRHLLKRSMRNS